MSDYVFFTDATTDLYPAIAREMDVIFIPLRFTLNDREYMDYPINRAMSPRDFYALLRAGNRCIAHGIPVDAFEDAFTSYLEQGRDILFLACSSALSSTYKNACEAAKRLMRQYPGRTVRCVDTLQASMGEGLIAYTAAMLRREGESLEEVAAWVEENRNRFCAWFMVDDLSRLHKGGKLGALNAAAGMILGLRPLLHIDSEGRLAGTDSIRGRKAGLDALVKKYADGADNFATQTVFICHSDCIADARYVAEQVQAIGCKRIEINDIGPVIGTHTGSGAVAIFYTGSNR